MKRSLSGDKVHVHSFLTLKRGSPLVAQQGAVMHAIELLLDNHVPEIYHVGRTWYLMETVKRSLAPVGYLEWKWDVAALCMGTYWTIPESWVYPIAPRFDIVQLYGYIEAQGWSSAASIPSPAELSNRYLNTTPRLTHGDLTHENTIIQPNGNYKFIDWQAQRHPYIPPHRDVDYGKLLQSLLGWSEDSGIPHAPKEEIQILLRAAPLAWFWCAIHFMRIKVRSQEGWQHDVCDRNIDFCFWLGEKEKVA
jgi:hypothetical protein